MKRGGKDLENKNTRGGAWSRDFERPGQVGVLPTASRRRAGNRAGKIRSGTLSGGAAAAADTVTGSQDWDRKQQITERGEPLTITNLCNGRPWFDLGWKELLLSVYTVGVEKITVLCYDPFDLIALAVWVSPIFPTLLKNKLISGN